MLAAPLVKLPIVTPENLDYCKGLKKALLERRGELLESVLQFPMELTIDNEHLQFRAVMDCREEVDALVFGVALLVNSVSDAYNL